MSSTPTYNTLKAQKQAEIEAQNLQKTNAQVGQQVNTLIETNKNPVLEDYMRSNQGKGLTYLGDQVIAADKLTRGKDAIAAGQAKINAALNNQLDPIQVLEDPTIPPEQKVQLERFILDKYNQQTKRGLE